MKKDDLYELIATLSATEKKVFKEKYAGKEDGNFIRLFDAIVSGEAANDAQVKKKFAGEKFVSHLGKTKAYLYEAVLQTLQLQLHDSFARFQILRKIELAETLVSRKLTAQAEEMLSDALKEAQQAEEMELELFIRAQLNGLYIFLQREQKDPEENLLFYERLNEYLAYGKLFRVIFDSYTTRGKKGGKDLNTFFDHPLLKPSGKFLSKTAERSYEVIQSLLLTVQRDYAKALEHNLKIAELIEPLVKASVRNEIGYISGLFNAALTKQDSGANAAGIISQLEKFEPVGHWAKSHRFVCLLRLKMGAYALGARNAEGKKLLKLIEEELPVHKKELNESELIKLHISVASLCLKEKEYNRALDYLLLFNQSKMARENRPVLYRVAMLYQLIAYYELENFEWLTTTLRNYKYFQQTNDSFYLIEKHTLEFLNKALRLNTKKERDEAKKRYEKELLKAAESQQSGLAYLFSIDWIKK